MLQLVLFNLTNGLIVGAFYVLMALGLSLIINLSNVVNFAHGNFLAIGGYIAFTLTPWLGFWGALGGLAVPDGDHGLRHREAADPARLRPQPHLQPAADLRPWLHPPGRLPLHLGTEPAATGHSRCPVAGDHARAVLRHLVPGVHGRGRSRRRRRPVRLPALHPGRHAHPRGHARPRHRVGARRQRCGAALLQLRGRQLPRRTRRRAGGRPDRPQPQHGRRSHHAELHCHHRGRCRQPDRHLAGRPADRCRRGADHRRLSRRCRGGDLRHHGHRPADPAARVTRRGRNASRERHDSQRGIGLPRGPGCSWRSSGRCC